MRYTFERVTHCEMCGDPTQNHKILGQRLNQSQGLSPKKKEGISVTVKQCTSCDLIYSSPMPIPENIQDHYGIPPEDYWDEAFIDHPNYFLRQVKLTRPLLKTDGKVKALDIGTGIGKATIKRFESGKFWLNLKQYLILCHHLKCYPFVETVESDSELAKMMRERWKRKGEEN